jgi:hypothetical protein
VHWGKTKDETKDEAEKAARIAMKQRGVDDAYRGEITQTAAWIEKQKKDPSRTEDRLADCRDGSTWRALAIRGKNSVTKFDLTKPVEIHVEIHVSPELVLDAARRSYEAYKTKALNFRNGEEYSSSEMFGLDSMRHVATEFGLPGATEEIAAIKKEMVAAEKAEKAQVLPGNTELTPIQVERQKMLDEAPPGQHYEFYYMPPSHSDLNDDPAHSTKRAYLTGSSHVIAELVSDTEAPIAK